MILILIFLLITSPCYAQNIPVDQTAAADALQKGIKAIISDHAAINALNQRINFKQQEINTKNDEMADLQAQLTALNSDLLTEQTDITKVAKQASPLQPAIDFCNSNFNDCINWTI